MKQKTERKRPSILKFDRYLAEKIGLNEAIVISQLEYWTSKIEDDDPYKVDRWGQKWVYNSYPEWQKQFPFWSERTIRRTMDSLMDHYYIICQTRGRKYSKEGVKWSNEYSLCKNEYEKYLGTTPGSDNGQSDPVMTPGTETTDTLATSSNLNIIPDVVLGQDDLLIQKSESDKGGSRGQSDRLKTFEGGHIDPLIPEITKNTEYHSNISTPKCGKNTVIQESQVGETTHGEGGICAPDFRLDDTSSKMSRKSDHIEAIDVTADFYRRLDMETAKAMDPFMYLVSEKLKQ